MSGGDLWMRGRRRGRAMLIYMIRTEPGHESETVVENQRQADRLKWFGYVECTRSQWLAMKDSGKALLPAPNVKRVADSGYQDPEMDTD